MKYLTAKDFDQFDKRYRGHFFNSLTGFKPLNLIGTVDKSGQTNLAIINSVFHLGSNPSLIGFISRPHSVPRHSLENLKELGFYTLNHVNEDIYSAAHQTSARYDKDQSEFQETGLTEDFKNNFKAPYVKESHIQIGMKFIRDIHIPENDTVMVIGEVQEVYLPENIIENDGHLKISDADSICGAGLDNYLNVKEIARLSYAKTDKKPEII